METFNNTNLVQQIIDSIPNIKDKLKTTTNEYNCYKDNLKVEKFEEIPNEKEEEAIKRAESIYDRLDEIIRRRKLVLINGKETIELIENVKLKIENVVKICENDEFRLAKANDELIDKIIKLEERKMNKEIEPLQQQINNIKEKFGIKKKEWDNQKLNFGETIKSKEENHSKNLVIYNEEMKQIEEWTQMKIGNIIFDSNVDNWNVNTSLFDEKVLNKSNLIFLIEDENGNLFGGYVNAKIDKIDDYIHDPKSFLFSLKSNGRLNGMVKFDIQQSQTQNAFCLWNKCFDCGLVSFGDGNDLCIYKENLKGQSYCNQKSFNYNGIQNSLCGKSFDKGFVPTRITAVQLI